MQRAESELCFIGATRTDETMGLKSALQRAELFDFLLRLARHFVKANFDSKERISSRIGLFIRAYIRKITSDSVIEKHRQVIRACPVLNEFLFDNRECLFEIFVKAK